MNCILSQEKEKKKKDKILALYVFILKPHSHFLIINQDFYLQSCDVVLPPKPLLKQNIQHKQTTTNGSHDGCVVMDAS